ncbi:MAG: DUF4401 domain-containing protein [bacterium]
MSDSSLTLIEVLDHPEVRDLLKPGEVERITATLCSPEPAAKAPLYIRILSGIGAWFAAIFLVAFLGSARILNDESSALVCGLAFVGGAVALAKTCKSTFPGQLALALVFAGNGMVVFGIAGMFSSHEMWGVVLSHGAVCAVVYGLFPSSIYRFLAPVVLAVLATIWISVDLKTFALMHVLIAAEMLLAGGLVLHARRTALIQPLMHAAAVMLPATILFMNLSQVVMFNGGLWQAVPDNPMAPSSAVLAGGLIYLFFRLAGGVRQARQPWLLVAVAATLMLGIFTTPGILVAIALLVAGYAFGDRALSALAYIFLPCFLVVFYYAMNVNLAHKAWIVGGSGLLLLGVRWLLRRSAPVEVQP